MSLLPPPLLFTVTLNGYEKVFGRMMATHASYAERHSIDHAVIGSGEHTDLGRECAWLKIVLILAALDDGRPWIFFADNDTVIRRWCPDFRSVDVAGKDVFMARGFSGRYNSGVIIVRNTSASIAFFRRVLSFMLAEIPAEDDVGWGENGAVIHVARSFDEVADIPRRWNNNRSRLYFDYVRHYSAGPLRRSYRFSKGESQALERILSTVKNNVCGTREAQIEALDDLYRRTCGAGAGISYRGAAGYFA